MAIAPELRAQILRLYQAELWRIGTIATQLHVHRDTVRGVIATANVMRPAQSLRAFRQSSFSVVCVRQEFTGVRDLHL